MTEINWEEMIDDLVTTALEIYIQDKVGKAVINELFYAGENGASFNQLKDRTKLNPSSLQRRLGSYIKAGLVENFLRKAGDTRFYSQYRLTAVGRVVSREVENVGISLRKKIATQLEYISEVPEVQNLTKRVEIEPLVVIYTTSGLINNTEKHFLRKSRIESVAMELNPAKRWEDIARNKEAEKNLFSQMLTFTAGDNQ